MLDEDDYGICAEKVPAYEPRAHRLFDVLQCAHELSEQEEREYVLRAIQRLCNGELSGNALLITGAGGTGKTHILGEWSKTAASQGLKVGLVAPTHKALMVLANSVPGIGPMQAPAEQLTVHKLLGIRLSSDIDPEVPRRPLIHEFDLLIVDEASMLSAWMYGEIIRLQGSTKIIFIGDPAQLKPVGDKAISPCFRNTANAVELKHQRRQRKNEALAELGRKLRASILGGGDSPLEVIQNYWPIVSINEDVVFDPREELALAAHSLVSLGLDVRIVAFTNDAVDDYNRRVHRLIHPASKLLFEVGECVIANKSTLCCISTDPAGPRTRINNAEQLSVIEVVPEMRPGGVQCLVHRLKLLRKSGQQIVAWVPDNPRDLEMDEQLDPHRERRAPLSDFRHVYATTVHKSQGSTYDAVLVDLSDIKSMPNEGDMGRALYVATSRPTEKLLVFDREFMPRFRGRY